MATKKLAKDKEDKNVRRVREFAAKLATEGMSSGMYREFDDAEELAQFCLDVAIKIANYTGEEEE